MRLDPPPKWAQGAAFAVMAVLAVAIEIGRVAGRTFKKLYT
jgi:hypothetical protein